jgi:hypothetical protein
MMGYKAHSNYQGGEVRRRREGEANYPCAYFRTALSSKVT